MQMCRTISIKNALHNEPSMTACFSHSQCPSITNKDFNPMYLTKAYQAENVLITPRIQCAHNNTWHMARMCLYSYICTMRRAI